MVRRFRKPSLSSDHGIDSRVHPLAGTAQHSATDKLSPGKPIFSLLWLAFASITPHIAASVRSSTNCCSPHSQILNGVRRWWGKEAGSKEATLAALGEPVDLEALRAEKMGDMVKLSEWQQADIFRQRLLHGTCDLPPNPKHLTLLSAGLSPGVC